MIEVAIGIASFSAGVLCMGIFAAGRGDVCAVSDDWHTITRLTEDVAYYWSRFHAGKLRITALSRKLRTLEAENADLHIDIAAKAQRLAEAGLQSSGGIDPTVSA